MEKKKLVCHDCGKQLQEGEEFINYTKDEQKYLIKCKQCWEKNPVMENYQECDVYSRVVGFHTPVRRWNDAKAEEWKDRKTYKVEGDQENDCDRDCK